MVSHRERVSRAGSILLLCSILCVPSKASLSSTIRDVGNSLVTRSRRTLNLTNLFGSATGAEAYDRIASQPVFSVGTPWGSPYLIFERLEKGESRVLADEPEDGADDNDNMMAFSSGKGEKSRQVALYFMDPHDAIALRDEMLQMDAMKDADMRICVSSLGKAISQASNLGKGLPTGQPIEDLTGKMKTPEEGGTLRYKIVPPKRELFYAARCYGRERVGLGFGGSTPEADAELMLQPNSYIGVQLGSFKKRALERLKKNRGQVVLKEGVDPIQKEYAFMEGSIGIPVFYCQGLEKHNKLKGLLRFDKNKASPLFFSYEDLKDAWSATRSRLSTTDMPENPPEVEVFNLIDVVSSIDKSQWLDQRNKKLMRKGLLANVPVLKRALGNDALAAVNAKYTLKQSTGLENVVFVANSKSVDYKELISKLGNSKGRGLRPMRPWGRDA
eukprot:CAMPEP_0197832314 /NCGR_PEP_ID=MMETSP1437-20131217/14241_1 /TAXON_ID=49252 ORGANISM="Eucampia antarctica, Strain CCMP1452" /NCGR_SAMPLE_ID=MMETSP1437 /ASSEMBLY_ACC=CAM_ASM_001096 /LENGTH=443 /DNA_ID=CAMNT_0043435631 /DNA_START=48 /DNA_END=1379 /DNA_ORIENTATION=+